MRRRKEYFSDEKKIAYGTGDRNGDVLEPPVTGRIISRQQRTKSSGQ